MPQLFLAIGDTETAEVMRPIFAVNKVERKTDRSPQIDTSFSKKVSPTILNDVTIICGEFLLVKYVGDFSSSKLIPEVSSLLRALGQCHKSDHTSQ